MKFIDLFAGLGGFHVALQSLEFDCVFACEKNEILARLYEKNFGIPVYGDIRQIGEERIPKHNLLCAGFPCQPFSKAGYQKGLKDLVTGTLFDDIVRILEYHRPEYFILENVANLMRHDKGRTWEYIIRILRDELKYDIDDKILSPHQFGIPQIRERIFIVGSRSGLSHFKWPEMENDAKLDIREILDINPNDARKVPDRELRCLDVWQEFLYRIPSGAKLPSFPIWSMEFGATYPYRNKTPFSCTSEELDNCLGAFGVSLYGTSKHRQLERIPKYARQEVITFPRWKQNFISQNREFYLKFKSEIDPLLPEIMKLPPSWQKFEWNCQDEERKIKNFIIQFRASGIRVKRPNYSPSLIASTATQIPIIGWENRYMTKKEGARLQSLETIDMPEAVTVAFRALGNAVNAKIIRLIATKLCKVDHINQLSEQSEVDIKYRPQKISVL